MWLKKYSTRTVSISWKASGPVAVTVWVTVTVRVALTVRVTVVVRVTVTVKVTVTVRVSAVSSQSDALAA